ncbi:MAG: phytanoyl-CoA dioxygenase family protein [Caldilineaceae bacterium]|nr:phytanoyl-CoA dioxygenase family protein [Caldilineaceae bacterium]
MAHVKIDDRDWSELNFGQHVYQLEVEGYTVMPDLLSQEHLEELRTATARLDTFAVDYSVKQQVRPRTQFVGGAITELIAHTPTVQFLERLFGDEIVFMSYAYARSEPGHPGISIHTDGQPYGSEIFGYEGSCPCTVRVLYYLQDLTEEVSPFRVVPRSHLAMHAHANPYLRYESHPEEVMVTAEAGSAVMINHRVFHGNFPNAGNYARELLAIAYRPAWAGPVAQEVEQWPQDELEKLPDAVKPFFIDRNIRRWNYGGGNKPDNMASEAPGINPSRWELA